VAVRAQAGETPLDVLRKENELLKQTISSAEVAGKQQRHYSYLERRQGPAVWHL
jgi:hypothetical protein